MINKCSTGLAKKNNVDLTWHQYPLVYGLFILEIHKYIKNFETNVFDTLQRLMTLRYTIFFSMFFILYYLNICIIFEQPASLISAVSVNTKMLKSYFFWWTILMNMVIHWSIFQYFYRSVCLPSLIFYIHHIIF